MPPPNELFQYGAGGVLLLFFVWLFAKGGPAVKAWLDGLLTRFDALLHAFREEIQQERELGLTQVREERLSNERTQAEHAHVIEANTKAVEALQSTVQSLVDKQK